MAGGRQKALELLMTLEDDVSSQLKDIQDALGDTGDAAGKSAPKVNMLASAVSGLIGGLVASMGVHALKELTHGLKELADHAAEIPALSQSFEALGGSIEVMREGAAGMVSDVELMKAFNQAAQLVSRDFAQTLPNAMKYMEQVAASTGVSVDYLLDSYVTGIGRLSPMILDNLAIQVDLTQAYEDFAKSAGKSADALTKQEQQLALSAQVMDLLKRNTEGMPDVTGSAVQEFANFGATLENLRNEIGVALLPVFRSIMGAVQQFLPIIQNLVPALAEMGQKFGDALGSPEMQAAIQNMVTQLAEALPALVPQIMAFAEELIRAFGDPSVQEGMMSFTASMVQLVAFLGVAVPKVTELNASLSGTAEAWAYLDLAQGRSMEKMVSGQAVGIAWIDKLRGIKTESQEAATATGELSFASEDALFAMMSASAGAKEAGASALSSADGWIQLRAAAQSAAAETAEAWGLVGEAMKSAKVVEAMHEMAQLVAEISADMNAGLVETQEAHIAKVEELQFTHSLKMEQAEQMYQAKRLLLQQAGKAEELAELDAKHAESQSIAGHGYSVQMQLQERALIDQEIMQMEAYIAQLQMQQEKVQEALGLALMESDAFKELEADTQYEVLKTIHGGLADKLRIESEAATESERIANLAASGQIQAAADVAAVWIAQEGGPGKVLAEAEAKLNELKNRKKDFTVSLPPLDLSGFQRSLAPSAKAAGAGAARTAREATEPATRAMSEVVKQVDDGIEAAMNAIENLVDFEIPAGVEAGLAKFGEFIAMSVKALYNVFETHDLKKQIDTFQEYLAPVTEILSLVSTALPIDEMLYAVEAEWPNLEIWGVRLLAIIERTIDVLHNVRAMIDDDLLAEVAGIVENVQKVLSLVNINGLENIREIVDTEFPSMVDWGGRLAAMIERAVEVLQAVRANVGDDMLKDAAAIVENVEKVAQLFSMGGVEAMREIVNTEFPSMEDWGGRLAAMIERGVEVLDAVRNKVGHDLLAETAAIVENVQKVAAIFGIGGIEAMKELVDTEWPDLTAWGGRLAAMIERGVEVLQAVRANVGDKMLREVAGIVEDVQKVTSLFGVSGIMAMKELVATEWPDLTVWGARLYAMLKRGTEVLDTVRILIGEELLETVTAVSDDVGKVASLFGMGGLDAMQKMVDAEWPDLEAWGARLYAMIQRAVEVLEKAAHELPGLTVAAKVAENVNKALSVLGTSLSFELPSMADYWGQLDTFLHMLVRAAEEVRIVLGGMPGIWADAEQFAIKAGANISTVLGLLGTSLDVKLPSNRTWLGDIRAFVWGLRIAAESMRVELEQLPKAWADSEMFAAKAAENLQKVMGVLGTSLDVKLPSNRAWLGNIRAYVWALRIAADDVRVELERLPQAWADSEMFAVKAAENLQKVMGLLSIDLEIKMPKAPQAKIKAWSTAFQTMATLLLAEIEKIRAGPFGDVLEKAAEAAGHLGEVFDLTKIFSAMPDAMKVPPWGGTAFAQRVNRVLGEALDLLIPNIQALRNKYQDDLLDIDDFVQLVSDQLTAVAGFMASLGAMEGAKVTPTNIKSVFGSVIGALQTAVQMLGQVDFAPIAAFGPAVDAMASTADGGQGNAALVRFVDATTRFDDATLRFEASMTRQEAAMLRLEHAAQAILHGASAVASSAVNSADYSSVGA